MNRSNTNKHTTNKLIKQKQQAQTQTQKHIITEWTDKKQQNSNKLKTNNNNYDNK